MPLAIRLSQSEQFIGILSLSSGSQFSSPFISLLVWGNFMTEQTLPPLDIGHPAPQRKHVGLAALLFGIAAAPAAWNAQLLLSVALSGHACYPRDALLSVPLWSGLWSILLAISLVGIMVAVAGVLVAWRSWRHTFDEREGSAHQLLDLGEGRTRFMAMCGILSSALFLVALVFATAALYLVPLCGY